MPTATLAPEVAARTITLMAPSKTYNLAGLGCAFAVITDPALRRRFTRAAQMIVPHVNVLGYVAALAAYRDGDDWLRAQLAYLRGNRDRLEEAVAGLPGLSMAHVEATYLGWLDARGLGVGDPCAYFEAHGLGFGCGKDFAGEGFVRVNFGCTRAMLEQALTRLRLAPRRRRGARPPRRRSTGGRWKVAHSGRWSLARVMRVAGAVCRSRPRASTWSSVKLARRTPPADQSAVGP